MFTQGCHWRSNPGLKLANALGVIRNYRMTTTFETFLKQHDEESWSATLTTLLRSIHEVDRNATQIWFAFYPLSLFEALEQSDEADRLAKQLLMQGNYSL